MAVRVRVRTVVGLARVIWLAAGVAILGFALTACGDDGGGTGDPTPTASPPTLPTASHAEATVAARPGSEWVASLVNLDSFIGIVINGDGSAFGFTTGAIDPSADLSVVRWYEGRLEGDELTMQSTTDGSVVQATRDGDLLRGTMDRPGGYPYGDVSFVAEPARGLSGLYRSEIDGGYAALVVHFRIGYTEGAAVRGESIVPLGPVEHGLDYEAGEGFIARIDGEDYVLRRVYPQ